MATGCGTILYPERRGQPHGRLDWGVVALDGIGLLFFFIPGVIAFAVDFATGAIYLPPDRYGQSDRPAGPLTKVRVPAEELTKERIEQIVSAQTSKTVELSPGNYRSSQLGSLEEFWSTHDALAAR